MKFSSKRKQAVVAIGVLLLSLLFQQVALLFKLRMFCDKLYIFIMLASTWVVQIMHNTFTGLANSIRVGFAFFISCNLLIIPIYIGLSANNFLFYE